MSFAEQLTPNLLIGRGREVFLPSTGEVDILGRPVILTGFENRRVKWMDLTGLPEELLECLVPGYLLDNEYECTGIVALKVDDRPLAGIFQGKYAHNSHRINPWSVASLSEDENVLLQTPKWKTILASLSPYPGYDFSTKKDAKKVLLTLNETNLTISWI